MKPFSSLEGQIQARTILSAAVSSGRLAHAYIFAGPEGSGRLTAALDLARVKMCGEEPGSFCGKCRHCKQIDMFSHPDVRFTLPMLKSVSPGDTAALLEKRAKDGITPLRFQGNSYISIQQIRELEARLSKKSFEGRGYVEIVTDAHLMRTEAANAMLKTLEEPPPSTLIILITSSLSSLLPTVRSRAHTVRFGRLTGEMMERALVRRGFSVEKARRLAWCSDGCVGRALLLSGNESDGSVSEAGDLFISIAAGLEPMEAASLAGTIAREKGREGSLELCGELISIAHDARRVLAGSRPVSREKVPEGDLTGDSMLEGMIQRFGTCAERIRGNVSPAMALAAAMARPEKHST